MQLDSLLKDYVEFNLWANSKMVAWLHEKPYNSMEYPIPLRLERSSSIV